MKNISRIFFTVILLTSCHFIKAEDGYRLWLRYDLVSDQPVLNQYSKLISGFIVEGATPSLKVTGTELQMGLSGLLGKKIPPVSEVKTNGIVVAGTPESSEIIASLNLRDRLEKVKEDGYVIINTVYRKKQIIVIAANKDLGVLYGTFHLLRLMQMHKDISKLAISEYPKTKIRILNHWDNLDSSVERGYAGRSIWNWNTLPDTIPQRLVDYARANASVGINATVLTNVNANAQILTKEYLVKVAAIANVFRPYGIKVYLAARYSAPIEIGKLNTADAHNPQVIEWWKRKAAEIYSFIPDFGGFIVKANSEGQPGPQNYKQTHTDGANLLADAVAPYNGIIMWRAFVYDNNVPEDRVKQAYNEFVPFDGQFRKNVIIQVKNGPLDFQPREPFSPLFGAMQKTPLMMEFQITQEYLGFSVYLVFQAPLYEETLKSDTYAKGKGSLVAKVIDGTITNQSLTGMAGVSNIGNSKNWTGHPFGQANWYTFGRQAWNPYLSSREIANEWIRMTFSSDKEFIERVTRIMLSSREIAVNFMTPIGLHHIMSTAIHYGPGPWVDDLRRDWNPVYYHRADSAGIGFERSSKGSNAVAQYFPPVRDLYDNLETCPDNLLLWFHHVPWDYKMKSGRTVWGELCYRYNMGVDSVRWMQKEWNKSKGMIDNERFEKVQTLMVKQEENARIWRDACLLYFQTFSRRPIPENYAKPEHSLEYYKSIKFTSQW